MSDESGFTVLGLMSGTSMDGLDCGLFRISITDKYCLFWELLDFDTIRYNSKVQSIIQSAHSGDLMREKIAHMALGQVFAVYVKTFLKGRKVDLIGSHGHTIAHRDGEFSIQVGDPQYLCESQQVPVVYDFRSGDIAAGGNGAPLMPYLDWLLFRDSGEYMITLNIGGMANITAISPQSQRDDIRGFDTGPGMALIDDCVREFWKKRMDEDGRLSEKGKVNENMLADLMAHPFIDKAPPKSTGRHEFSWEVIKPLIRQSETDPEDTLRTLIRFTAKSISWNVTKHLNFPCEKTMLIVSGGGVHHPALMQDLKEAVPVKQITDSRLAGIDPDMKESLLIAVLTVSRMKNLTSNMPGVTGADKEVCLGQIYKGKYE